MICYGYNDNGYYTSEKECQKDPLESKKAGEDVWLLPAKATFEKPLDPKEGFRVKFVDGKWEYELIPEPEPELEPTEEEKKQMTIAELKGNLASTDWCVIKIAEGAATKEEYADVIIQRQSWRAEINELEKQVSLNI